MGIKKIWRYYVHLWNSCNFPNLFLFSPFIYPLECNITFWWTPPPPLLTLLIFTEFRLPLPPSRRNNVFERPLNHCQTKKDKRLCRLESEGMTRLGIEIFWPKGESKQEWTSCEVRESLPQIDLCLNYWTLRLRLRKRADVLFCIIMYECSWWWKIWITNTHLLNEITVL